jgi:hypothetical protein
MNTVARCARPATRAVRPAGRVVGGGGVVAKASPSRSVTHLVATLVVLASAPQYASAVEPIRIERDLDQKEMYFKTINDLASDDDDKKPRRALSSILKGPRGKEIEKCARKCTSTCIRGGQGAPGLGPLSVRKELVVFKPGYRSGKYCLSECVQICAIELGQGGK